MFRQAHRCAATLFLCFILGTTGAWAQAIPNNQALGGQVGNLEATVFGKQDNDAALFTRVDTLEKSVYGAPQPGGLENRVQNLAQAVFHASPSNLAAPNLITGNDNTNSVPPSSSTTDADQTRKLLQAGVNLVQQNNDAQAGQMFQEALVIDPSNADALFNLGALMEKDGNMSQALSYYQQAATSRPNDAEITQAVNTVKAKITANQVVPAPLQQGRMFYASPVLPTETMLNIPNQPNTASAKVAIAKPTSQKAKGLLHKIGQIAKVSAVVAATVLENTSVSYGGAASVDSCVCQ